VDHPLIQGRSVELGGVDPAPRGHVGLAALGAGRTRRCEQRLDCMVLVVGAFLAADVPRMERRLGHGFTSHEPARAPLLHAALCTPAFVLLAVGCGQHWDPRLEQPTPMKPADAVLIWSSGTVEKWHGVVITADSVSGIPYGTSLKCDSCRRSIALGQVDSMKVRHRTGAAKEVATYAGALTFLLLVEVVVCYVIGPKNC